MCADSNSTLLPHQHTTRVSGSTLGWVVDSAFVAEAGNATYHDDTCYLPWCMLYAFCGRLTLMLSYFGEPAMMNRV